MKNRADKYKTPAGGNPSYSDKLKADEESVDVINTNGNSLNTT